MDVVPAPVVIALLTAPLAGAAMEFHDRVRVVPGAGIPGDRYARRLGYWSDPRWPDQELTLVEAELLSELELPLDGLRRNVVTRHIDLGELIGHHFYIGSALLLGVRPCTPCSYIEGLTRPGLLARMGGRGGLRVTVVEGGDLATGDEIRPWPGSQ